MNPSGSARLSVSAFTVPAEGLAAAEEPVGIGRRLVAARPDTYLPDLADSLQNLAVILGESGRLQDACTASQEVVDIRRRLARLDPGHDPRGLVDALDVLSVRLAVLGGTTRPAPSRRR